MSTGAKERWDALREEYFEAIMAGKVVTLHAMAIKYGVNHQSVRNKSSKEKWPAQLEAKKKEREQLVAEKLAERTSLALDQLNQEFVTSEVEIRKRHALMARGLQVRAVKRLKEIPLEAFTARDALTMLKMGLEEERRALGLPEYYVQERDEDKHHGEYKSVAEQIGGHKKIQSIGMQLLKALREQADTYDIEDAVMGPDDAAK